MTGYKSALTFVSAFCSAFLLSVSTVAQVVPAPGAKLNYTQIMFEHPQVTAANEYKLEIIADGAEPASFIQPLISKRDSSNAVIVGGLEFGKKYVWRYTGLVSGKTPGWKGPYRFEILSDPLVDKSKVRIRVVENDLSENTSHLVALDMARIIIDRKGKPVWFLPDDSSTGGQKQMGIAVNDMRVTAGGTITLLYGTNAEERDLAGHVLWQAPEVVKGISNDAANVLPAVGYTHCFKKLSNGHYMIISGAIKKAPAPGVGGSSNTGGDTSGTVLAYEILKEFDKAGKLVWSWSSENYFNAEELSAMMSVGADKGMLNPIAGGHMNAFDVDETNGFVYLGFRNVSRVIKIEKKSGKVLCAWGPGMSYNGVKNGEDFFVKQHETALLKDGSLAVFNNNILFNGNARPKSDLRMNRPSPGIRGNLASDPLGQIGPSAVVIFSQPNQSANSHITWKYDCRLDSMHNKSLRGGSVNELKNGNLLVSMGAVNRVFEITRSKQIVWNAVIEKRVNSDTNWIPLSLYKAYDVSSLYPCYFSIATSADTLKKPAGAFKLRIFNVGTEEDSYRIQITSEGGYKKQVETKGLPGQTSTLIEVAPDIPAVAGDKLEITVQSVTNPDFKRVAEVEYLR